MNNMTLEQAINHLEEELKNKQDWSCVACKEDHEQLLCWLKELQAIKSAEPSEAMEWLDKFKGIEISALPFKDDCGTQEVDLNEVRYVGSQLNNDFHKFVNTLENYILKAQEQEKVLNILKRIIKVKPSALYEFELVIRGTDEEENIIKEWLEKNE